MFWVFTLLLIWLFPTLLLHSMLFPIILKFMLAVSVVQLLNQSITYDIISDFKNFVPKFFNFPVEILSNFLLILYVSMLPLPTFFIPFTIPVVNFSSFLSLTYNFFLFLQSLLSVYHLHFLQSYFYLKFMGESHIVAKVDYFWWNLKESVGATILLLIESIVRSLQLAEDKFSFS